MILIATVRTSTGKQAAGALRRQDLLPAVVYGEGKASLPVTLSIRELTRALKTKAGENVLVTLHVKHDSKKPTDVPALIKELQHHPVSHRIIHVDFHQVSLTKRITVTVPLGFKGEAVGVRMAGGLLEHLRWEIDVECLPTEIPSEIPVDVSGLELGKTLHAKDVLLAAGVRLVTDAELPVASCVTPKEEAAPAPAEAAAQAAEPEVLKQKKPEEIAAEEEAREKDKPKDKEKEKAKQG